MDEYDKVNETRYGTGIGFDCEVEGIDKGWALIQEHHLEVVVNLRLLGSPVTLMKSIQIYLRLS